MWWVMKVIAYKDYNIGSGVLFDLEEAKVYKKKHLPGAVNVPFEKMMANYKTILTKDNKYYFYCHKGVRSKKVVSILEYYGYDVTVVTK